MTLQSLSLLSNEKLHESGGTNFTVPGSGIPNWFHYHCKGSSICFWFRKKFPMIALCIVYSAHLLSHLIFFTIKLYVNGHEIESKSFLNSGHGIKENVHLFDFQNTLQSLSSDNEAMKEYIKDGWNHAELKLKGYVRWMGVYVYKQNHDKEDVRFSNPMIL
ncbi:hypothetical protein L6164_001413 [Bauhinia variegata]|uniref:Uncharacterized protein n=1 Tax=Bauhinia variegata TaxID=167791 RepID=A0ACB9QA19_BAUVA|nr:hypothetical protein L6164_001413 [Bauhinia variegata]